MKKRCKYMDGYLRQDSLLLKTPTIKVAVGPTNRNLKIITIECTKTVIFQILRHLGISKLATRKLIAWFPLSQLRPQQRPISSKNKAISMKDDCSTL